MIDREAVVDALRNCINKPRCQNCKWKECNEFHETFELPKGLVMDAYDLLKDETHWRHRAPIQSLIDHIKTAVDVDPWAKEMLEELLSNCEPVRCKYCAHYHAGFGCDQMIKPVTSEDSFFCAYGKRE